MSWPRLGLGLGWRQELALAIDRRADLGFVEVIAENLDARRIPPALDQLRARGVRVVVHGIGLGLGGAERPDRGRLRTLASLARRLDAPFVSEHVAFVRAGGREAGHLLPVARTREALAILAANVREAQAALDVPLVLENVAGLFEWPGAELDEAAFLSALVDRTGAGLLLDLANWHANARNHGWDAHQGLRRLPLEHVAYVHVAGGVEQEGLYHDTHAHAVAPSALELLRDLATLQPPPGVLLERDAAFPAEAALNAELDDVASAAWLAEMPHG